MKEKAKSALPEIAVGSGLILVFRFNWVGPFSHLAPPGKAFGILSILPSIESAPFEDLNFTPHPLQGLCRVNRQLPPNDCNFNRQSTEGEILPKTFVLNSFKFQGSVKMLFVALSVFKAIIHPSLLSYN